MLLDTQFFTFLHQDGAGTVSFDSDPTFCPVGARRVQAAKWTVERKCHRRAARAVQPCPEQEARSL